MKCPRTLLMMMMVVQVARLAWAGQIEGEFYPEKRTYLVGEPVFVTLRLTNRGIQPVWISTSCVWLDTRFEAPTAPRPRRGVSLFGCMGGGTAGSCGSSATEIRPDEQYTRRYLLDGPFRLDGPGVYPIRAWHKVDIYADETSYRIVDSQEVVSEFDLSFVEGNEEELASAYAPILRDLKSPDTLTSFLARCAVVDNPPPFLENLILGMADDPQTAAPSIGGLERLGNAPAKAKLAELGGAGKPESIRQMALEALGGLGDPGYCSLMLNIARESSEYSRFIALRAAGYLCGEKALPLLTSQLASADHSPRFEAAYALGNSHCRKAVPLLISLLLDPDSNVRRAAGDSLATLTHRHSKDGEKPVQDTYRDWATWWASNGATAPVYGPGDCTASPR